MGLFPIHDGSFEQSLNRFIIAANACGMRKSFLSSQSVGVIIIIIIVRVKTENKLKNRKVISGGFYIVYYYSTNSGCGW